MSLAQVDKLDLQYTYKEGAMFYFMDSATYEEVSIDEKVVGDKAGFFLEGMELSVSEIGKLGLRKNEAKKNAGLSRVDLRYICTHVNSGTR